MYFFKFKKVYLISCFDENLVFEAIKFGVLKKSSGNGGGGENGGEAEALVVVMELVLRVAMHCRRHGYRDKVRGAVRDITLAPGVEAADTSAESSGEVRLLAMANLEWLRARHNQRSQRHKGKAGSELGSQKN